MGAIDRFIKRLGVKHLFSILRSPDEVFGLDILKYTGRISLDEETISYGTKDWLPACKDDDLLDRFTESIKQEGLGFLVTDPDEIIRVRRIIEKKAKPTSYKDLEEIAKVRTQVLESEGYTTRDVCWNLLGQYVDQFTYLLSPVFDTLYQQLIPNAFPVYRNTTRDHAGKYGGCGPSCWFAGEDGRTGTGYGQDLESGAIEEGRILIRSTFGELRRNGALIADPKAYVPSVALIHRDDNAVVNYEIIRNRIKK